MKVGLSFSRCVLDIYQKKIDIDDVLIIISRTNFDPLDETQWNDIWTGYTMGYNDEWRDLGETDKEEVYKIVTDLHNTGRLHQPRQYGYNPLRRSEYWLDTVLPDSELERNPAAKKAWENFQVIAGLSNIKIDHGYM